MHSERGVELALLLCVGVFQVEISAQRPAALTSDSCLLLSSCRHSSGQYLKLGHDRFLPYPFQFLIY
jgi:hypothetical protein